MATSDAVIYDNVRVGIRNAQEGYLGHSTKPAIHPSRLSHLWGNAAMMPSVIHVVWLVILLCQQPPADKDTDCVMAF